MENRNFDYFYGTENESYLFLQVPKVFFKDSYFKNLSDSAKIMYSLFLERTELSIKNNWRDEHGRVYIIYTIDEIMEDLNCWKEKVNNALKALKEIGLIKTVRQGLTKPNLIYVMNYATALKYSKEEKEPTSTDYTKKFEFQTLENSKFEKEEKLKIEPQKKRKNLRKNENRTQFKSILKKPIIVRMRVSQSAGRHL